MPRPRRLLVALLPLLAGCGAVRPELPEREPIPEPDPASVESVLFLVGDAGQATAGRSPVVERLRREVEWWSETLDRDSSVTVVFLGDNVYPVGLRGYDHPEALLDSARLQAQVDVLSGLHAQRNRSLGLFVAGNHDWGGEPEVTGLRRLRNMEEFLERVHASGPLVELLPSAGNGGPAVVDVGRRLRLILLDTAWWLFFHREAVESDVLRGIEEAMASAGERHVALVAHHPFRTGGSHGGLGPFRKSLGIRWLLAKSGALLQDVNSRPYRALLRGLRDTFSRTGPPLLFAGGHDHSLQVFRSIHEGEDPLWSVVSGSASKLTEADWDEGQVFRRSDPGYMRLVVHRNGAVDLFVEATAEAFQLCEQEREGFRIECVQSGIEAFRTVYSRRLSGPTEPVSPLPPRDPSGDRPGVTR